MGFDNQGSYRRIAVWLQRDTRAPIPRNRLRSKSLPQAIQAPQGRAPQNASCAPTMTMLSGPLSEVSRRTL